MAQTTGLLAGEKLVAWDPKSRRVEGQEVLVASSDGDVYLKTRQEVEASKNLESRTAYPMTSD